MIRALLTALCCTSFLFGQNNTFLDYQNYNHGYCPDCNACPCDCPAQPYRACPNERGECPEAQPHHSQIQPCYPDSSEHTSAPCEESAACEPCEAPPPCDPSAPVAGSRAGISICAIGISLLAVGAVAAIIVTSSNGSSHTQ